MLRFPTLLIAGVLAMSACSGSSADDDATAPDTGTEEADLERSTTTETSTEDRSETDETTSTLVAGPCDNVSVGGTMFELDAGGAVRTVQLYVPTSFEGAPLPLVLNWHGLGSNGGEQASLSGYEALAQQEGFIVAHPTGVPAPGDTRNSWELPQFDQPDRDDVAFASALIDELVATACVDESRVYSTGMSNGGFFTSRLVCELSDRIAAAASVAGTTHPEGCEPSRVVPYLSFHGTADEVVGFNGGGSSLAPDDSPPEVVEFFDQVIPDEFAEFAANAGCGVPETTELTDEVTRTDYPGCESGAIHSFYTVLDAGHTWPGSALGIALQDVLGPTTSDISATELSWEFFQNYSLG